MKRDQSEVLIVINNSGNAPDAWLQTLAAQQHGTCDALGTQYSREVRPKFLLTPPLQLVYCRATTTPELTE
jgi:hypothetical protein